MMSRCSRIVGGISAGRVALLSPSMPALSGRNVLQKRGVRSMSPTEFVSDVRSRHEQEYQIVDVREREELALASLGGGFAVTVLPLSESGEWMPVVKKKLDVEKTIYCLVRCPDPLFTLIFSLL